MANNSVLESDGAAYSRSSNLENFTQQRGRSSKRDQLQAIKEALLHSRSILIGELSVPEIPLGEGIGAEPGDTCDLSASELEQSLSLLFRERGQSKLRAIEHAIERIKEGTFGICEVCGGEIPLGRLRVMPFATTCVLCKSMQERSEKLVSTWKKGLFSDDIDVHEFSRREEE